MLEPNIHSTRKISFEEVAVALFYNEDGTAKTKDIYKLTSNKQDKGKREEVRIVSHEGNFDGSHFNHGSGYGVVAEAVYVQRHAFGHAGCADHILQDEVPSNGEGDELAHADVAVHVG